METSHVKRPRDENPWVILVLLTLGLMISFVDRTSLSGCLLDVGGSYEFPMLAIFVFLLIGASSTVLLLQRQWAPKVNETEALAASPGVDHAP